MKEPEAKRAPNIQGNPSSNKPRHKKGWALAITGFVGLLLCVWLVAHLFAKPKPKPTGPAAVPVSTGTARTGSIDIYLDALGTVTPVSTVTVTSRVSGALTEVHFQEGQMVKKGDLLAIIDPRPYEAALLQAQ